MSMHSSDSILYCERFHDYLGEDVLQVLKCGICLEFYDNPVVLPCGHTFCYNCLLQMGKHANRNKKVPVHDLTIGCPNCRCPIFVVALLQRDVTLNYPIQSLIDGLKGRKNTKNKSKMVDEGTNTEKFFDTEEDSKKKSTIPFLTSGEFEKITRDFDRFTSSLKGGSVINDAFFSIEKIRNQYSDTFAAESCSKAKKNPQNTCNKNKGMEKYVFQSKMPRDDVNIDPAIVSYSVCGSGQCTSGFNLPKPNHVSIY
ncbi:hypothetical protein LOTGIDRAFT_168764 [Lottia gigantea]|uniref:RING-type domain-containing protein n=1 Tax=Lottia gigantea TaxID=225164 RepID=V3ZP96_LOTGI|nr:hypothetical protein LOTGIDRAFT_168764 [Lottia gigantea]ESO84320.1 hypothetical protein LOTGIDRAFT_168764 [Lottia gigantea]